MRAHQGNLFLELNSRKHEAVSKVKSSSCGRNLILLWVILAQMDHAVFSDANLKLLCNRIRILN